MKHTFLIFTFCCCGVFGFSQTDTSVATTYKHSLYGIGIKQQQVSYLSPLYYNGLSLMYSQGRVKPLSKNKMTSVVDVNFDIFGHSHSESVIFAFGADYTLNMLFLLPFKNERLPKIYAGAGGWAATEIDIKPNNVNNGMYYNINNKICFSFALEKKFKYVYIFNECNLPLFGFYFGTEYSSILPYSVVDEDAADSDVSSDFKILDISQNTQIQNRLNVDFKIKSRTLRLQYVAGYKMLRLNNNTVHNASHVLKIGYLFNKTPYVHK